MASDRGLGHDQEEGTRRSLRPLAAPAYPSPGSPRTQDLFRFAVSEIRWVVESMWPGGSAQLSGLVPSITNVVARVDVDGSEGAFAKYGFLGMSLVSILRGHGGSWPEVLAAQDRYVSGAPALAAEARQLELLARAGVPVSALLGYSRGVLVSEQLIGPTLADQLVGRPEHAAEWLEETWSSVQQLHQPAPPDRTVSRGLLVPRGSISATFERKLTGAGAGRFISGLGAGWLDAPTRQAVCWSVERSVRGLSRLCSGREGLPGRGESGVVFGDLKPEHVIFRHGGGPVLCDPMVHRAGSVADVAKLVSRVVLTVHAAEPGTVSAAGVGDGIAVFVEARMRERPPAEQLGWLRDLLVLWAMDALNISTTHLSAPPELPVAGALRAVERWAPRMIDLASVLTTRLTHHRPAVAFETAADTFRASA